MLFDWLYPANFPVILACLEAWSGDPVVTTPLLKFVNEFVLNKSQRLIFDSSSPNGILLFREVSKVGEGEAARMRGGGEGRMDLLKGACVSGGDAHNLAPSSLVQQVRLPSRCNSALMPP